MLVPFIQIISQFLVRNNQQGIAAKNREVEREVAALNRQTQVETAAQMREMEREIAAKARETQLEIAQKQRELMLQQTEANQIASNWPLSLTPAQMLTSVDDRMPMPVKVLIVPPAIQYDRHQGAGDALLRREEQRIMAGLRQFFGQHYSFHSRSQPTELLDGIWVSSRFYGGASIRGLYSQLRSQPLLLLEAVANGEQVEVRAAYWGLASDFWYETIGQFPFQQVMQESAKRRALEWRGEREKLIADRATEEELQTIGGEAEENIVRLQQNERLERLGVKKLVAYQTGEEDADAAAGALTTVLDVIGGWFTDMHFLTYAQDSLQVIPTLPKLLPTLLADPLAGPIIHDLIARFVMPGYLAMFGTLAQEQPYATATIAAQVAQDLSSLPDESWAQDLLVCSLRARLAVQEATERSDSDLGQLLERLMGTAESEDRGYLEHLKSALSALGEQSSVDRLSALALLPPAKPALKVAGGQGELTQERASASKQTVRGNTKGGVVQPRHERKTSADKRTASGNAAVEPRQHTGRTSMHPSLIPKHIGSASGFDYVRMLIQSNAAIHCVAFSPDGQYLAGGDYEGDVGLWKGNTSHFDFKCWISTRNSLLSWLFGGCLSVAFGRDGRILAASGGKVVKVYQVQPVRELRVLKWHDSNVNSVAFDRHYRYLVTGDEDGNIVLWEASSGKFVRNMRGHDGPIYSLAFAPDGTLLASGGGDSTIKMWEVSTGKILRSFAGHPYLVNSVAISPDGRLLVSGGDDNTIKLWEAGTGKIVRSLQSHQNWVNSVAISPDGRILASGGRDNTIKLWDISTGRLLQTLLNHEDDVCSLAFRPDGQVLASGSQDKTIRLWAQTVTAISPPS